MPKINRAAINQQLSSKNIFTIFRLLPIIRRLIALDMTKAFDSFHGIQWSQVEIKFTLLYKEFHKVSS